MYFSASCPCWARSNVFLACVLIRLDAKDAVEWGWDGSNSLVDDDDVRASSSAWASSSWPDTGCRRDGMDRVSVLELKRTDGLDSPFGLARFLSGSPMLLLLLIAL